MNPPLDNKDLLWRNELLQQATRRSSLMLQQSATSHQSYFRSYPALPPSRALPQLPESVSPSFGGPPLPIDPQHYSMLRLELLRNHARLPIKVQNKPLLGMNPPYHCAPLAHDALKIQHETTLGLNHQAHSLPQPRPMVPYEYTQFVESSPWKLRPPAG